MENRTIVGNKSGYMLLAMMGSLALLGAIVYQASGVIEATQKAVRTTNVQNSRISPDVRFATLFGNTPSCTPRVANTFYSAIPFGEGAGSSPADYVPNGSISDVALEFARFVGRMVTDGSLQLIAEMHLGYSISVPNNYNILLPTTPSATPGFREYTPKPFKVFTVMQPSPNIRTAIRCISQAQLNAELAAGGTLGGGPIIFYDAATTGEIAMGITAGMAIAMAPFP